MGKWVPETLEGRLLGAASIGLASLVVGACLAAVPGLAAEVADLNAVLAHDMASFKVSSSVRSQAQFHAARSITSLASLHERKGDGGAGGDGGRLGGADGEAGGGEGLHPAAHPGSPVPGRLPRLLSPGPVPAPTRVSPRSFLLLTFHNG